MLKRLKIFLVFLGLNFLLTASQDLYDLALMEYRAGRYSQARELILKKIDKKAGDYNLLGWIQFKLKNFQEAEEAFLNSLKLEPNQADSYAGLGYVFLEMGNFQKALEFFEKGLALNPKNDHCLEGKILLEKLVQPNRKKETLPDKNLFFVRGSYFWIQKNGEEPVPLFVKGVNLGLGLPGKYPSEFPEEEKLYRQWLRLMAEMGANAVRIYTILPPEFYRAFYQHNLESPPNQKLFLFQGIWVELPVKGDFREENYIKEIKSEIKNAVDVIHGQAIIKPRYGHAHGIYKVNIADYVLGFIFGREWEPRPVIAFNQKRKETEFNGQFLVITNGSAFEVFLAEMLDYLITYEDKTYQSQRPVSFVNWPTLDPLFHPSEATLAEEIQIRRELGETPPDYDLDKSWDDDAVKLDETKIILKPNFRAGLFASYHVYPYYPDFMKNEDKYALPLLTEGSKYYSNYLRDLKNHYQNLPLLIAEFGLPTSRGVARFHPEGLNHGGLTEEKQAEGLKKLFISLKESGCAGGLVFSLIDEWWKTCWMTAKYEDNDPLWFNPEDPEENYGLIAFLPSKAEKKLKGDLSAWSEANILYYPEDEVIGCLSVDSDEGYLYLKIDLKEKIDWKEKAILMAIDVYGDEEGDHLLPFNLQIKSPVGFEFVILLHGENSQLLVDDSYSKYEFKPELSRYLGLTGFQEKEKVSPTNNANGIFSEIITVYRRRFSRNGKIFEEKIYNASPLKEGQDFRYFEEKDLLELRIPWSLLNFLDPSNRRIIYADKNNPPTEGLRILALAYRPAGKQEAQAIARPPLEKIQKTMELMKINYYRWSKWKEPTYQTRLKKSFYVLKELYHQTKSPSLEINFPPNFNFNYLIELAYKSKMTFLSSWPPLNWPKEGSQNNYGYALACLTQGLTTGNVFYLLEAKKIFSWISQFSGDLKEKNMAAAAIEYLDNLLQGKSMFCFEKRAKLSRVEIKKEKIKRKGQKLILGKTSITLKKGATVKTQVDRVIRDWLSQYNLDISPFSFSPEKIVPWHEGARIKELIDYAQVKVYPIWGTRVKKFGETWYAPDEKGLFRFPLSEEKVYFYPTNFILDAENVIINDTHGINVLTWEADGADLVVGCGDHQGKVEAAYYLALKGINVYMPADKALAYLIGAKTKGKIIGSAPIKKVEKGAIIGHQPISIDVSEPIVVSLGEPEKDLHYYDAPFNYFKALEDYLGVALRLIPVKITAESGAEGVVLKARQLGAKVIGIRIRSRQEHDALAAWLKEDKDRRAILFHTAIYEEGYRLFFEFPEQTSFGDIYPSLQ
ncbi:MAG: tetratricopeptide repeat protein [Candidatus Aminicenantes bacterium]|nr:tetratricopeptide repeat protein [Candidatus Aminicenantes bacterium]